jgi:hypothetical protein
MNGAEITGGVGTGGCAGSNAKSAMHHSQRRSLWSIYGYALEDGLPILPPMENKQTAPHHRGLLMQ